MIESLGGKFIMTPNTSGNGMSFTFNLEVEKYFSDEV